MVQLSMTERYTVLLLNAVGKHTDIAGAQYSSGIVLGGIYELIENGCVSTSADGKIRAIKPPMDSQVYLTYLYENICSHSARKISKWLDFYCFGATFKNVRPLVENMYYDLSNKGILNTEVQRGLFRTKRKYRLYSTIANEISQDFQNAVLQADNRDDIIFSVQMLLLADVFNEYFSGMQRLKINKVLSSYKKAEIWKGMESYTNSVRNFNYQNAVNTGVM